MNFSSVAASEVVKWQAVIILSIWRHFSFYGHPGSVLQGLGLFEWSDAWQAFYTKWGENEPGRAADKQGGCVIMKPDGRWYNVFCDIGYSAICKKTTGNSHHGSFARYVKLRVAHAPGMPGTFTPPQRVSDPDMHPGTCVAHVPWCMPEPLTSGFLWIRWQGKRSRYPRRMRNPQFYVSGKRPLMKLPLSPLLLT